MLMCLSLRWEWMLIRSGVVKLNTMPSMFPRHTNYKECFSPCKMSSNNKQQNRFSSCERVTCAMQWTQHGGESKAHPRSSRGSTLPAGAFTSHAPQPRLPRVATTRATSFRSFANGYATNVVSVPEHTHKERTLRSPRKMMPMLVTNRLLYNNEAGARCIWPSLSRGLTLTAEAST